MDIADWCCRKGLNFRPLPYQGSALPLSYGSMVRHGSGSPRTIRATREREMRRNAAILATRAPVAQPSAMTGDRPKTQRRNRAAGTGCRRRCGTISSAARRRPRGASAERRAGPGTGRRPPRRANPRFRRNWRGQDGTVRPGVVMWRGGLCRARAADQTAPGRGRSSVRSRGHGSHSHHRRAQAQRHRSRSRARRTPRCR